ncbi:hypothetical protein Ctob_013430 [Chrysochromulina tobinii]|uniref:Uncharacterized protein n=1 Tax=Chrysochromulina tobinii TaxID=1460289 RepID=A0A0M0JZE6_9EUKA|nr:hypothetical protein Ctob_013430 [Chrysochromulina tobinii]|eukprot:KOO31488.1 hypothetical protein Ctob_013430 [Chrysochromulina sp. CCMP291]
MSCTLSQSGGAKDFVRSVILFNTWEEPPMGVEQEAPPERIIDADDEPFIKLRIEADIAALEWVKMAQENGAISLKENVIALGMEVQLARLIKARDTKDMVAGRECYKLVEKPLPARDVSTPVDANVELDARMKAHSAMQQTGSGEMEQMD